MPAHCRPFSRLTPPLALALLLAACAPDATQSTLKPVGEPAIEQKRLFIAVVWIAAAVFVIVEAGSCSS